MIVDIAYRVTIDTKAYQSIALFDTLPEALGHIQTVLGGTRLEGSAKLEIVVFTK